ncbi:MAG TPA: hypothetical protein VMW56_13815 [Candidatus Margulisiibacteriota bacterium]|nr:hypothetical protein [Candidatus Margulisiibacteriota bacterium]
MRMVNRNRGLCMLGAAALGVCALVSAASANPSDVTTEQGGSVIILPKVIWDGTRDTIIQIANVNNVPAQARCFYIDGGPLNPNLPVGPTNPQLWNETDFGIFLTKQQPTQWVASQGRRVAVDSFKTAGYGIDPGLVPPVRKGFTGELKCVQVDDSDIPLRGNSLKGEATLRRSDGDVSKYNAIALRGNSDPGAEVNSNPNQLNLDWTQNNGAGQYSACPDTLIFNHIAYQAPDLVVDQIGNCNPTCYGGTNEGTACTDNSECTGGGKCLSCPVTTNLTLVPCSEDIEDQIPSSSTVQFAIWDEFERRFSSSVTVNCWLSEELNQIHPNAFSFSTLGTFSAHTRITPNPGAPGVLGVAEETVHDNSGSGTVFSAVAAYNLDGEGNRFDTSGVTDTIILPAP